MSMWSSGSHTTLPWREVDSNLRSPVSGDTPQRPANHLASYHLPRKLGLRFAPKALPPSRKSSEPRRPVFKIELKPRRSAMTLSLPANRCTGHVILGLDRLTRHAAQMDREPELKIIRRAFTRRCSRSWSALRRG